MAKVAPASSIITRDSGDSRPVLATYELWRNLSISARDAYSWLSNTESALMDMYGHASYEVKPREPLPPHPDDHGLTRFGITVNEKQTACCCPYTLTVKATTTLDPDAQSVAFHSVTSGVEVSHVYAFKAQPDGGCVANDRVEIRASGCMRCLGCYVVPTARKAHARGMDGMVRSLGAASSRSPAQS